MVECGEMGGVGLRLFATEAAARIAARAGGGVMGGRDAAWMGVLSGDKAGFSMTAGFASVAVGGCCSAAGSCTSCKEEPLPSRTGGCLLTGAVSARLLLMVPVPCSSGLAARLLGCCTPSLVASGTSPVQQAPVGMHGVMCMCAAHSSITFLYGSQACTTIPNNCSCSML